LKNKRKNAIDYM